MTSLGELLGAALKEQAAPGDSLVPAATDLIASHYALHPDHVGAVIWEIAADLHDRGGALARLLSDRHGFSTLGLMAVQRLLDSDEATAVPLLALSIH